MHPLCKILISYHKKSFLLKDDVLTPIHAGRSLARKAGSSEQLDWLLENTVGDDTGDHISEKNGSYNEMTSVYWAWKNYAQLGSPKWIGFMHYRRHFLFRDGPNPFYENEGIYPGYLEEIGYSPERLQSLLTGCDFLCVKPQIRDSMYDHYRRNHRIEDLDRVIAILKEKYPEYSAAADRYLENGNAYFCNMFVFPKETFFRYAAWIFDILFEFEHQVDLTEKRLFISEWLTGIFIQKLLEEGLRGTFLPTIYAEEECIIPVVMALDNSYVMPTSVAIASLLVNARKLTKYHIHLMVPPDFTPENQALLRSFQRKFPGCQIDFLFIDQTFEDSAIHITHITRVTFYRLLIPSLLPQYSKVLYLDSDLVATTDLSEFFRTNVDDFYLAGIIAAGYLYPPHHHLCQIHRLGLPDLSQYVNAGVLILNLKKIRAHNLEPTFLELAKTGLQSQDQDVLNIACYGSIKVLPPKFNVMTKYLQPHGKSFRFDGNGQHVYSEAQRSEALARPVIIHYADKKKPWQVANCPLREAWLTYFRHTPFYAPFMDDRIRELELSLAQKDRHSRALEEKLNRSIAQTHTLTKELVSITASSSFRLGCAVTWLPRKSAGFFRCAKESGLRYTLSLLFQKIRGKLHFARK